MKKIFLLLLIFHLFVACSDNDDNNSNPIILTSIKINPIDKDLFIGDSYQLTIQTEPEGVDPKITWSSSDTKVATVSNKGLITTVNDGITTITATYGSLSNNITLITYKKQDYTSFVVKNGYKYGIVNCVVGHRQSDRTIKKIATIGNIGANETSLEARIDYNTIKDIIIYFDNWEGEEGEKDIALVYRTNNENMFLVTQNTKNAILLNGLTEKVQKNQPTEYPQ